MRLPAVETLPELVAYWARQSPDRLFIADPSGDELTYGQMDDLAWRLTERFRDLGVRRGDRVAVSMPKSACSVACMIGAMRAGAAYVPIDFSAPGERNRLIAQDGQVRVACVDTQREAMFRYPGGPALMVFAEGTLNQVRRERLTPAARHDAERLGGIDLAYILYTSGSTGVPKGVVHTHASALSFVRWAADTFQPRVHDRFSSHALFQFDLSVLDLYVPQTVGASVTLIPEALGKDPRQLAEWISRRRITIWYSVPSILALMAQYGNLPAYDYSALRLVLFAGEVFPLKHLRLLKNHWSHAEYFNLYGPTETNVCTYFRVPDVISESREAPFPIGSPCENVRARVVDDQDREATDGEGQLVVHASGPTMRGYWNLADRTAAAFLVDADGERWYRTGDLVRPDAQGAWEFAGRRDRMIKRHGYRIELAEVEAALYRHPEIEEAAAIAVPNDGGVLIQSFLATKDRAPLSIIALKQYCVAELPGYMIPDRFAFVESLPRTATDKVDYQRLLAAVSEALPTAPGRGQ
jgi:amino acid adenylation domain-containing protein